jgi:hypothetical protein
MRDRGLLERDEDILHVLAGEGIAARESLAETPHAIVVLIPNREGSQG